MESLQYKEPPFGECNMTGGIEVSTVKARDKTPEGVVTSQATNSLEWCAAVFRTDLNVGGSENYEPRINVHCVQI